MTLTIEQRIDRDMAREDARAQKRAARRAAAFAKDIARGAARRKLQQMRSAAQAAAKENTPRPLPGAIGSWPQDVLDAYRGAVRTEYEAALARLLAEESQASGQSDHSPAGG